MGIPRVWSPQDDIDSHFKEARDETLSLVKIFSKVNLSLDPEFNVESNDDFDFQRSLIILSEAKQIDITNRFKRESDAFYLEAKRSVVATTAKIPPWVIIMMIVLGWNEFMAILRSPTYIVLAILCGSILYIIYALNLWGPAERIVSAVTNEATKMIKTALTETINTTGLGNQQHEMASIREHYD